MHTQFNGLRNVSVSCEKQRACRTEDSTHAQAQCNMVLRHQPFHLCSTDIATHAGPCNSCILPGIIVSALRENPPVRAACARTTSRCAAVRPQTQGWSPPPPPPDERHRRGRHCLINKKKGGERGGGTQQAHRPSTAVRRSVVAPVPERATI